MADSGNASAAVSLLHKQSLFAVPNTFYYEAVHEPTTLKIAQTVASRALAYSEKNQSAQIDHQLSFRQRPSPKAVSMNYAVAPPPGWVQLYDAVVDSRRSHPVAPVDVVGCSKLASAADRGTEAYRFQSLVALMLSAQTKDEKVAEAMHMLLNCSPFARESADLDYQNFFNGKVQDGNRNSKIRSAVVDAKSLRTSSRDDHADRISSRDLGYENTITLAATGRPTLTVERMVSMSEHQLVGLISMVSFYQRKADYILRASVKIIADFGGFVPNSAEGLMSLPGVGPKMAHLFLQHTDNINSGIGVDLHVHRIAAERWRWVPSPLPVLHQQQQKDNRYNSSVSYRSKSHVVGNPERTRRYLELWLPKELWRDINPLLVGHGQTFCFKNNPRCGDCPVRRLCPSRIENAPKRPHSWSVPWFLSDKQTNLSALPRTQFRYASDIVAAKGRLKVIEDSNRSYVFSGHHHDLYPVLYRSSPTERALLISTHHFFSSLLLCLFPFFGLPLILLSQI